jgi:ABC-type glycerol-3-phosphate transport system substrate-binding protein
VTTAVWNWSFGVSSDSKNKDAAYAWCQWATSSDVLARLGAKFINPVPRKSSQAGLEKLISNAADRMAIRAMNKMLETAIAPRTSTNYGEIRDRYVLTVNRIFTGEATNMDAELAVAAADCQKLLDAAR